MEKEKILKALTSVEEISNNISKIDFINNSIFWKTSTEPILAKKALGEIEMLSNIIDDYLTTLSELASDLEAAFMNECQE